MTTCLHPGCPRIARSRGLCLKCYHVASKRVAAGTATWEHLEAAGLAWPAKTPQVLKALLFRRMGRKDGSTR